MSNNFASFFVALTLGILYGVSLNITAPVILEDAWSKYNAGVLGLISVCLAIGATIGSFFGGFISDRAGPKKTLFGGILICLVCEVWIFTQREYLPLLIILRAINGLGIGVATSIGPQYIGEQASAERRGMFGTMFQLFICLGQLIAFATGLLFHPLKENWRYDFLSTGLFALIFLIGWFCLPESAGYLAAQAKRKNSQLRSSNINSDGGEIQEEETPSIWDDVKTVFVGALSSKRAFITGVVLATFQQITGINIFMLYSGVIFEDIGWVDNTGRIATIIMGAWNLVVVIIAIFLVDKLGRKPLLIIGFSMMFVGLILMAILGFMKTKSSGMMIAFVVPSLALFLLGFQMGPGPMFFVTVSELYDAKIRGRAMGLIVAINWIANIVVSQLFPVLFEVWGMPVFIVFAVLSFIVIFFVIFFVQELKGTVLEGQEDAPLSQETSYLSGDGNPNYSE